MNQPHIADTAFDNPGQTMYEHVAFRFDASWVKRFHAKHTIITETLGQHSHTVAMIVQQVFPQCSKRAILAALEHDLPEFITGDVPAPAKWASPQLDEALSGIEREVILKHGLFSCEELDAPERALLKWADMAALVMFCMQEVRLGNSTCKLTVSGAIRVCEDRAKAIYAEGEKQPTMAWQVIACNTATFMKQLIERNIDV